MEPDFRTCTLALTKEGRVIFSSDKSGMRPIIECVKVCSSKYQGCALYDKVVGLASARCIVHSGMIVKVSTQLISLPAEKLLKESGIRVVAVQRVPHILNKDRSAICPMEERALKTYDSTKFFEEIDRIFYPK